MSLQEGELPQEEEDVQEDIFAEEKEDSQDVQEHRKGYFVHLIFCMCDITFFIPLINDRKLPLKLIRTVFSYLTFTCFSGRKNKPKVRIHWD